MLRQEELEAKRRQEDEDRKRKAEESKEEMRRANEYQMKLKVGGVAARTDCVKPPSSEPWVRTCTAGCSNVRQHAHVLSECAVC